MTREKEERERELERKEEEKEQRERERDLDFVEMKTSDQILRLHKQWKTLSFSDMSRFA